MYAPKSQKQIICLKDICISLLIYGIFVQNENLYLILQIIIVRDSHHSILTYFKFELFVSHSSKPVSYVKIILGKVLTGF